MKLLLMLLTLMLAPAWVSAQYDDGGGGGGGGAIPECSGDQDAFGVCLDTATGEVVWEGATADGFEGSLGVTDPTADRTWTLPDVSGTIALSTAATFDDEGFKVCDDGDDTKCVEFELTGMTASNTIPLTFQGTATAGLLGNGANSGMFWESTRVGFQYSQKIFNINNTADVAVQQDAGYCWSNSITSSATGLTTCLERSAAGWVTTSNGSGGAGGIGATPQTLTVADSGDGSPATATLTPTSSRVQVTCNDTNTCDLTMGETGIPDGALTCIHNVSANVVDFADTTGVSELAGAFAAGQYDSLCLSYVGDRWIEDSRSDN